MEDLVHLTMLPKKIAVQKREIDDLETQLDEMEQEAKKVTDVTM